MTSPEHTLVGVHGALALGVHRRLGWAAVVMAGIAANVPDWDGLAMLVDMQRFEAGHRVWGHNFVAIFASSVLLGWSQYRFRWVERASRSVGGLLSINVPEIGAERSTRAAALALMAVAFFGQAIHLPCDMVVSGGSGLSDWLIRPFWPFSQRGFVFPLVPWGDVGPTVILMAGAIACARWPGKVRAVSAGTLAGLCLYLVARGICGGRQC